MFQNFRRMVSALVLTACSVAGSSGVFAQAVSPKNEPLFNAPPKVDQGWQGLARVLEALTPGVDTSIPLTASQITDRITQMINEGRATEALEVIAKREAQRKASGEPGQDVQLMFLKARAHAASGNAAAAQAAYLDMTTQYPELPEPWNNLATLYISQGQLDRAQEALSMALRADPNDVTAKTNLAQVHVLKAYDLYRQAGEAGIRSAARQAKALQSVLEKP